MVTPVSHSEHCMVCGKLLHYGDSSVPLTCQGCGRQAESAIRCPDGHFICDSCHGKSTLELLPGFIARLKSQAPEDILEELFELPDLPMHGPEHHPLVAVALLAALAKRHIHPPRNSLQEAISRCLKIPGGSCGYLGCCGAGIGLGVAVSLLAGATPVKGAECSLACRASAEGLRALADGHPRCCKRALRASIRAAREFLAEELGVTFPPPETAATCRDVQRNRECPGAACPFHPASRSREDA